MSGRRFQFGDRVRHVRRPEWGVGSIVRAEEMSVNGERAQRVSVRFANGGLKTISTAHAELELLGGDAGPQEVPLGGWERMKEGDWLAPLARRKVEEAMASLPPDLRDPFNSLARRLAGCLDLYRFDRSGRSLMDWAVAQSGLEDPLTRFTRHELEVLFDQWAAEREAMLQKLVAESRGDPELIRKLGAPAPRAAREALRRLIGER
jgi:hypothetical protein